MGGGRAMESESQGDFSTLFLSLYEEMKGRFKEEGVHATIQTLEKCQAMLLVLLEKGRPMRPYELVDALLFNPAYARCKDARRMVFYTMEKLLGIGLIERVEVKGRGGYYRIAMPYPEVKTPRPGAVEVSQITDPRVKPLLSGWKKVFELRSIIRLWGLPSLAHAMVYEASSLLNYLDLLKGQSNGEGRARLESIEGDLKALMEEYAAFARTGGLSEREARLFHRCEEGIAGFAESIWWDY
jgi:hypothetical protein